ncbi:MULTISPECIES: helix-turn-helix domain-containing protein [unclassified Mesorhizobium]|uniref:winged helix-turn-helix transcriptional regulator n=1 Tax=unclassified Mesorhizobium TaxID=325217 RepID=UPI000FD56A75|nr:MULTISPECIES: helix-turn-helix domain-containing protein [unclassified Mesorhizobium]RUW99663.1 transcriptional regulator [Mesorhizobium sp. M8A.F.Ca.ET.023.01.1.1]RUX08351.1 transcriptional regulator [Mesorhizobium sp. M8A.F.Ca.ET.059.01.1.1]RVD48273.1 transcriptional regulator [Mesorhizobium sp. M8A.F.Ca.ET.023.02.2.1]TGR37043.1 transcriptional regulator [bacterium M00.F.Ca.ET.199.01.1.1]TGU18190.1 transcriptional regulator [bacterium M00.F.Ca.ET.156.01.1.1]TGV57692.1 transcriptional reg
MVAKTSFETRPCPIARSLDDVGEWWSILLLRDAFQGLTRFDQFQKSLAIAPNILTRRLNSLVERGLFEKRVYCERPLRHEYVLTAKARDFRPVLLSLLAWGNKHLAPEGPSLVVVDKTDGRWAEPVLVDRQSGRQLDSDDFTMATGPMATDRMRQRYRFTSNGSGLPLVDNALVDQSREEARSK